MGHTILATIRPFETVVLECIANQGLELPVIFNKGAVMALPQGCNKASGLQFALDELGISPRNLVAIGDGENDRALLDMAEYSVAKRRNNVESRGRLRHRGDPWGRGAGNN